MLPSQKALDAVIFEHARQRQIWGDQSGKSHLMWNAILGEEVGEVARAILESDRENLREELIQVATVCLNWIEKIDVEMEVAARAGSD